jgi:hypothetical protein
MCACLFPAFPSFAFPRAQLSCFHEGGFLPLPADAPGAFPVMALRHVSYTRHDEAHRLRVASANESAELGVPPRASAIAAAAHAGAHASAATALAAALASAAASAARWAEGEAPLLAALRVRGAKPHPNCACACIPLWLQR